MEKIDKYLKGEMNDEERQLFETEMAEDTALAKKVELQQQAIHLIEASEDQRIKKRLQVIHQEYQSPAPKVRRLSTTWLRTIAAAAAIGLLVALFLFFPSQPDPQALFAQNFTSYELPLVTRGIDQDEILKEAGSYYHQGDYKNALENFSKIKSDQQSSAIQLAQGISHLAIGQTSQAQNIFESLSDDVLYDEAANWYQVLTYLKAGNLELAKTALTKIPKDSEFSNQAQKLIKALD